jgi:iron-sulfur cluster repair protein YtfE (RIC family)
MSNDSVSETLGEDHRRIDAVLADAKRALAAGDREKASACFAEFRSRLERHIVVEEEVLFPAFEALAGAAAAGPTRVMRAEHAEIRRLMAELRAQLAPAGALPATPFAELTALLRAHNGKEERVLYPASDRAAREAGSLAALADRVRGILGAG